MDSSILNFMLMTDSTVENLRAHNPPEHVFVRLSILPWEDYVKLGTASRAVTECFAPAPAPVVHPNYYQKEELKVKCRVEETKVKMGVLKRGQFLVLFKWSDDCVIANQVIHNLKSDFKKKITRDGLFENLRGVKFDSLVSICAQSGTIEVERYLGKWWMDVKKMDDWTTKSLQVQSAHILHALRLPEKYNNDKMMINI